MKASDISDREFVAAVDRVQRATGTWALWRRPDDRPSLATELPPHVLFKVALAKARKVVRRGLVSGCACGCRGDFEVTDRGRALLDEDATVPSSR